MNSETRNDTNTNKNETEVTEDKLEDVSGGSFTFHTHCPGCGEPLPKHGDLKKCPHCGYKLRLF